MSVLSQGSRFCSIIITHYSMSGERSEMMKASLRSLFTSTTFPFELILVDNGSGYDDSNYFLQLSKSGLINTYIRNMSNMHFGYARNQGIAVSQGDYICIADNDILYKKDWLTACIEALELFPGQKLYSTPMVYPELLKRGRYGCGELSGNGKVYSLNYRAGSNCFVIRREDLKNIGLFDCHRVAGSLWTDNAVRAGYKALVVPDNLADDLGLRQGYNFKECLPIETSLHNGTKVNFNRDGLYEEGVSLKQRAEL